ncbi:MAG: hypothetical protein PUC94_07735 [Bacteroidales bacterium]|nr:hypothetical protein [Bacteroidales bacterium]
MIIIDLLRRRQIRAYLAFRFCKDNTNSLKTEIARPFLGIVAARAGVAALPKLAV